MRFTLACLGGLALFVSSTSAMAQDAVTDRPSIVVIGVGRVERAPDTFTISADLVGNGRDQLSALERLAATQQRVMDGLGRLEGLEHAQLTTGSVNIEGVYDSACGGDRYDREESDCPVIAYRAQMDINLEASPISRAGDAVSLAAELGAVNAGITGFKLSDTAALRQEADSAAFADARRQADILAAASGQRIVRVLRLQDPDARAIQVNRDESSVDEIVVTGARVRPRVQLNVAPPPVREESRLTVFFEIE